MGKLFGTDGIRGVVGENLTADLAFRTGKAIAAVLKEEKGRKPVITIGKDTRISSDMLESALIAGICSVGGDGLAHARGVVHLFRCHKRDVRARAPRKAGGSVDARADGGDVFGNGAHCGWCLLIL